MSELKEKIERTVKSIDDRICLSIVGSSVFEESGRGGIDLDVSTNFNNADEDAFFEKAKDLKKNHDHLFELFKANEE